MPFMANPITGTIGEYVTDESFRLVWGPRGFVKIDDPNLVDEDDERTVDEVMEDVADDRLAATVALHRERNGKNRVTLTKQLEELLAAPPSDAGQTGNTPEGK